MLLAQKLMRLLGRVERGSNLVGGSNALLRIHHHNAWERAIQVVRELLLPQENQSDVVRNLMLLPARFGKLGVDTIRLQYHDHLVPRQ